MAYKRPVLLVEGRDDREVVYQICNHHRIDNTAAFETWDTKGYDRLCDDLGVLPKTGVPIIGAIVDADVHADQRWQSIGDVLRRVGYTVPDEPTRGGTFLARSGMPRVGLWMMPDNRAPGALEDYLAFLVDEGDTQLPRARRAVDEIPVGERRFPAERRSKAEMHTWLAWQEEPGTPLGLAVTRRYVNPNHPRVAELVAWLRSLFGIGMAQPA